MERKDYDIVIVGGGLIGLASALALSKNGNSSILVLEAESDIAQHQSGHNSGVIHSGIYYKPGSLKAQNCILGRQLLLEFCRRHDIPYEQCGKLMVAVEEKELPALDRLQQFGTANGLNVQRLTGAQAAEMEPHIAALEALFVPETAIVNFTKVAAAYARELLKSDVAISKNAKLLAVDDGEKGYNLTTSKGDVRCEFLVNCAGLQADRVAALCGLTPSIRIIPFRGEYYELEGNATDLVNNLIYPVPDPDFPFLGVHFTRRTDGTVDAGPNAIWAFSRSGYRFTDFRLADVWDSFSYPGFRRLVGRHWRRGILELYRSLSKRAYFRAMQRLIPELEIGDIRRGISGVRAQAVAQDGSLVDDFVIESSHRMVHVLNAPSPGATASLSIGEHIAGLVMTSVDG